MSGLRKDTKSQLQLYKSVRNMKFAKEMLKHANKRSIIDPSGRDARAIRDTLSTRSPLRWSGRLRRFFKHGPSRTKFEGRYILLAFWPTLESRFLLDHLLHIALLCLLYPPLPSFSPRTCVLHAPCQNSLRKAMVSLARHPFVRALF